MPFAASALGGMEALVPRSTASESLALRESLHLNVAATALPLERLRY